MALKADRNGGPPISSLVPVVLFINPDDAQDHRRCESLGATACVPKPTDFSQMKALMQDTYNRNGGPSLARDELRLIFWAHATNHYD